MEELELEEEKIQVHYYYNRYYWSVVVVAEVEEPTLDVVGGKLREVKIATRS